MFDPYKYTLKETKRETYITRYNDGRAPLTRLALLKILLILFLRRTKISE